MSKRDSYLLLKDRMKRGVSDLSAVLAVADLFVRSPSDPAFPFAAVAAPEDRVEGAVVDSQYSVGQQTVAALRGGTGEEEIVSWLEVEAAVEAAEAVTVEEEEEVEIAIGAETVEPASERAILMKEVPSAVVDGVAA